jgi:hypothetical protein
MPSRKSLERRRQVAGKILHIRNVEGVTRSSIPSTDSGSYVPMDRYQELLSDAKKLAGSILSSKDNRGFLGRLMGARR